MTTDQPPGEHVNTDPRPVKLRHPEENDKHYGTSMSWPDCNCIGCVYRQIAQELWVGFCSAWCEWPTPTVARTEQIQLHIGHAVTMTHHKATDAVTLYCDQCKVLMVLNRGREP